MAAAFGRPVVTTSFPTTTRTVPVEAPGVGVPVANSLTTAVYEPSTTVPTASVMQG